MGAWREELGAEASGRGSWWPPGIAAKSILSISTCEMAKLLLACAAVFVVFTATVDAHAVLKVPMVCGALLFAHYS